MTPVTVREPVQPDTTATRKAQRSWMRCLDLCVPYLLALLFFGLALYGVNKTDVVDTDAARHAMNGAFIYDCIRTGHLLHPIAYGKTYYSRLPSLSLPFHPPLFPAIEAIFFAIFGVNLLAARLAVAACVAVAAVLLYRLVLATLGRPVLAACVTLATFSLWTNQFVARDVMLEYPSLVFTLAALYCLRDFRAGYPMRRAIPFAVFAAAALWTKQHAVFLGAVPFFEIVLARRWRRLLELPLWISSALFGMAVLGIVKFSQLFHGAGVDQISTSARDIYYIATSTLPHYFFWVVGNFRGMPGILLVCAVAAYALGSRRVSPPAPNRCLQLLQLDRQEADRLAPQRKRDAEKPELTLYVAWILAVVAVLVDLGPIAPRYLFFLLPAAVTIAFAWLFTGCRRIWGERPAGIVASVFAVGFLVAGFGIPFDFLRGPAAAARVVVEGKPTRVLYAGDADGNFIFAIRELDPNRQVVVIPAVKLPRDFLKSSDLPKLFRRFGIEWVVFENRGFPRPWSGLQVSLPAAAKLERSIPLESSRYRWRHGSLDVYRFAASNPASNPASNQDPAVLQLSVPRIQGEITVKR